MGRVVVTDGLRWRLVGLPVGHLHVAPGDRNAKIRALPDIYPTADGPPRSAVDAGRAEKTQSEVGP
jgi:hypothetical protein